jgi:nitroreductase
MKVSEALATRLTVRAFKPEAVPTKTILEIIKKASRAPSGGNLQPWKAYVLNGAARDELVRRTAEARASNPRGEMPEYHIYPPELTEPYATRRSRVGEMMYATMNIPREDKASRLKFFGGNWSFFGAPAGMIFTVDRQMQQGQWSDVGMFLQSIMLLAREYGLHTCPQEAWAVWHRIIREYLDVPQNEMIFCGMAIGYADMDHPVNHLASERAALEEYVVIREDA